MKAIINKTKYKIDKYFCKLVIYFIGLIRRHSNDTIKEKIDKKVNRIIIMNLTKSL